MEDERKIRVSTIWITIGQIASAVNNFIVNVIMISSFGATNFGIITISQQYMYFWDSIFNFQSWETVVQEGSKKDYNSKDFGAGLKYGLILECTLSIVAFLIGHMLIENIYFLFHWDKMVVQLINIFLLLLFLNPSGIILGILRYRKKFVLISIHSIIFSVLYLIVMSVEILRQSSLIEISTIMVIINTTKTFTIFVFGFMEIYNMGIMKEFILGKMKNSTSYLKKAIWNNFSSTIDVPVRYLDIIFLSMISSEITGIYKFFQQIFSFITMLGVGVSQAMLSEIAILSGLGKIKEIGKIITDTRKKLFKEYLVIVAIIIAVTFVAFTSYIKSDINILFLIISMAIMNGYTFSNTIVHPTLLAIGCFKNNFQITVISNIAYVVLITILINFIGIYAVVLCALIQAIINIEMKKKKIKEEEIKNDR